MYFLQDMFQMTAIAFVSVINHYHINGLHLFGDTYNTFVVSLQWNTELKRNGDMILI